MRVRLVLVPAVVLAIVYACSGGAHFSGTGTGTGIGGQPGTLPDGGPITDGGPGDAGPGADAGCTLQTLSGVNFSENCTVGGSSGNTGSVLVNGCNSVVITAGNESCTGSLSGAANAFHGTCNGGSLTCDSTRVPGTLSCPTTTGTCTILVCGDATTSNCPPP
jgi:hypothetical protein